MRENGPHSGSGRTMEKFCATVTDTIQQFHLSERSSQDLCFSVPNDSALVIVLCCLLTVLSSDFAPVFPTTTTRP